MNLVYNDNGFNEIIVTPDCEWADFYSFSDHLKLWLNIDYSRKLHDFDSCYWDFSFKDSDITVHYNVFLGISIYPTKAALAGQCDNEKIVEILEILKNKPSLE